MGRGPGWLERAILDLLRLNEYLSAPLLAGKAYAAHAPTRSATDTAIDPTPAQRAAVRRALSRLQKRGLVLKLGSMFPGERCSYADREHALGYRSQRRAALRIAIRCVTIHRECKICMPTRLGTRHEAESTVCVRPHYAAALMRGYRARAHPG